MKTFYTIATAAEYFQCSIHQLRRYIEKIPGLDVARVRSGYGLHVFGPLQMAKLESEIARLKAMPRNRKRNAL
jgi:hypothetical protein